MTFRSLTCVFVCLLARQSIAGESITKYMQRRNDILQRQRKMGTGGTTKLNKQESVVNEFLMEMKFEELYYYKSNNDGQHFPPANHFLKAKKDIEKSNIFKIIKMMPKGGFDLLMDYVVWNISLKPKDILFMIISWHGHIFCITGLLQG